MTYVSRVRVPGKTRAKEWNRGMTTMSKKPICGGKVGKVDAAYK